VVIGVTLLPRGLHDIVHGDLLLRPGFYPVSPRLYPALYHTEEPLVCILTRSRPTAQKSGVRIVAASGSHRQAIPPFSVDKPAPAPPPGGAARRRPEAREQRR